MNPTTAWWKMTFVCLRRSPLKVFVTTNSLALVQIKTHFICTRHCLLHAATVMIHASRTLRKRPELRCEWVMHTFCLTSICLLDSSQGEEVFERGMRGAWWGGGRWEGRGWQREVQWGRDGGGESDRLRFEAEKSQLHREGESCVIALMSDAFYWLVK